MSHHLVKISLRRCQAQMVSNGAPSHKTNYIDIFTEILNLTGHPNRIAGSKVTAILLIGWILLPIGGASLGRVCEQPTKQACFSRICMLVDMNMFYFSFIFKYFYLHNFYKRLLAPRVGIGTEVRKWNFFVFPVFP